MAKVKIQGHALGSGVFTITAPNSNTDRTITLPDASVTLGTDATKLPLAGGTMTGDLILGDGIKIEVGSATGGDLQIYHDGSNSYINDTGTGNLNIKGANVNLLSHESEDHLRCTPNGSVDIYYNNVKKFETNTNGIGVTGTTTSTSLSVEKLGIVSSLVKSIEEVYGISGTISSSGNIIIDIDFNSSSATSTFVEISLFAYDGKYISYKHGAYWGTSWSGPHGSTVIENNLSSGMAVSFNNSPTAAHEVYTITSTGLTYPVVRVKAMGGATTASTNPSITFSHN